MRMHRTLASCYMIPMIVKARRLGVGWWCIAAFLDLGRQIRQRCSFTAFARHSSFSLRRLPTF
jgi:hypothetical protein